MPEGMPSKQKASDLPLPHPFIYQGCHPRDLHTFGDFFSTSITTNGIILRVILICEKLTLNPSQVLYDDFRTLKKSATPWCIPE